MSSSPCKTFGPSPPHGVASYYVPQAAQPATRQGVAAWEKLQKRLRQLAELNKEHILKQAREGRQ